MISCVFDIQYRVRYIQKETSISKFQETDIVCIRYRVRFAFMHNTISNNTITDIENTDFDIEAYSISEPVTEVLVFDVELYSISKDF